jgi:hypothetical protein
MWLRAFGSIAIMTAVAIGSGFAFGQLYKYTGHWLPIRHLYLALAVFGVAALIALIAQNRRDGRTLARAVGLSVAGLATCAGIVILAAFAVEAFFSIIE